MQNRKIARLSRHGFTIIELIIVVVIIGLLAAIAMPRFQSFKDRSYITSMRSDLRNLAQFEESYFYDQRVYSSDLGALQTHGMQYTGLVTLSIVEATATGWAATGSHSLTPVECGLFVGSAAPVGGATEEGEIVCN